MSSSNQLMTVDGFIGYVLNDICAHATVLPEHFENVVLGIMGLHHRGFSVDDAIAYAKCWEEVSPEDDPREAFLRMAALDDKYSTTPTVG